MPSKSEMDSKTVASNWHLGSMNDGLFIIDQPPRPSTDDVNADRHDGPEVVIPVHGLTVKQAQAVCDAHNAAIIDLVAHGAQLRKALQDLVSCHDAFESSTGNFEEAYYKLAKYAYPEWQAARSALLPEGA